MRRIECLHEPQIDEILGPRLTRFWGTRRQLVEEELDPVEGWLRYICEVVAVEAICLFQDLAVIAAHGATQHSKRKVRVLFEDADCLRIGFHEGGENGRL